MDDPLTCWPKGLLERDEAEALLACIAASDSEGYETTESKMAEEKLEAALEATPYPGREVI